MFRARSILAQTVEDILPSVLRLSSFLIVDQVFSITKSVNDTIMIAQSMNIQVGLSKGM